MLSRILNPPVIIGLLGPDGAGKSTIAGLLQEELTDQDYKVRIVHVGVYTEKENETAFLRTVKKVHGRITGVDHEKQRQKNKANRSSKRTLSKFGLGKSLVYFVDMLIRYLQAVTTDNDIVITDRFFHDLLFHNQSLLVRTLIRVFESGPIYIFRLSADSDLIAARSEHPAEYIEEMQTTLSETNAYPVDVGNQPEDAVSKIIEVLRDRDVV